MRLIDAEQLEAAVNEGLKENPHKDGFAWVLHRTEHLHFLDLIRRAPTIAPPSNPPLTLEELWEMDGEPVWCADAKKWGILEVDSIGFSVTFNHAFWCGHAENLTFYRRRPKEGPA